MKYWWLSIAALTLLACSRPRIADDRALHAAEMAWAADWASRDVDKIAGHYAEDAMVQVPGWKVLAGRIALRAGLEEIFAHYNVSLSFKPEGIAGGLVTTRHGTYALSRVQSTEQFTWTSTTSSLYTVRYRKLADGSWVVTQQTCATDGQAILPFRLEEPGGDDLYPPPDKNEASPDRPRTEQIHG